ncbi:hypothetical protein [Herbaspirillum sp. alder98]|uniref:hypothetical protein n=1 Tax=Herbaspirillum sp. alder98 TaxID=2913096 RepID=UPI001CD82202|nr:hypothetical protein [Herbaspirillum sp. alder98]MCA1323607.1 hypothetical protein [Herbaspirillum sp. alder98]
MRLAGMNAVGLAQEALRSNLAKTPGMAAAPLRKGPFSAQFHAYSAHGTARLQAGRAGVPAAIAQARMQFARLQGGLMAQLHGRFPSSSGVSSHFSGMGGGGRPGHHLSPFQLPFQLPFNARFSGLGAFYDCSGMQLRWNAVSGNGQPTQTTLDLLSGRMVTQTPWSQHNQQGIQSCKTYEHATGQTWQWTRNAHGASLATNQWGTGQDGIARRTMCVFLPGKPPIRLNEENNPRTGHRQLNSDWSQADAQGRRARVSVNLQTGKASVQFDTPGTAPPPHPQAAGGPAGASPGGDPKKLDPEQQKLSDALKAFGLQYGEPISEAQFASAKKQYYKDSLLKHPDKVKREDGEQAQSFNDRKAAKAEEFKALSVNFGLLKDEYDRQHGK